MRGNPAIDPGDAMVTVLSYVFFLSAPITCVFCIADIIRIVFSLSVVIHIVNDISASVFQRAGEKFHTHLASRFGHGIPADGEDAVFGGGHKTDRVVKTVIPFNDYSLKSHFFDFLDAEFQHCRADALSKAIGIDTDGCEHDDIGIIRSAVPALRRL